jgi:hypothetical protein
MCLDFHTVCVNSQLCAWISTLCARIPNYVLGFPHYVREFPTMCLDFHTVCVNCQLLAWILNYVREFPTFGLNTVAFLGRCDAVPPNGPQCFLDSVSSFLRSLYLGVGRQAR